MIGGEGCCALHKPLPLPYPATCAKAASAWGNQKVIPMARYRVKAVASAACVCQGQYANLLIGTRWRDLRMAPQ